MVNLKIDSLPFDKFEKPNFQSLLYVGNRHETVPIRLLTDPYLTARAKMLWQLIKLNATTFKGSLFPSYEQLGIWLSDRAYANKTVSRKIISQTLLLLRLTRWLTLCETVRNEKGQILGNVYIMNDEPISVADSIYLNDDYLHLVEKTTKHHDPVLRDVANAIIDEITHHTELWHVTSHIDIIRERHYQQQHAFSVTPTISTDLPEHLAQAVNKTTEKLLTPSSQMELGKNTLNILSSQMELSQKPLSSNRELSMQNDANSLILDLVPLNNKNSTSTNTNLSKYSTSLLDNLKLTISEKNSIYAVLQQLDQSMIEAVLFEAEHRIAAGDIKNPVGYLFKLIQRAITGEFKPYLFNKQTQSAVNNNQEISNRRKLLGKAIASDFKPSKEQFNQLRKRLLN